MIWREQVAQDAFAVLRKHLGIPDDDDLHKIAAEIAECIPSPDSYERKDAEIANLRVALLWIDTYDPEIVAAAEEKFGFKLSTPKR